jgi:hypothetical protein
MTAIQQAMTQTQEFEESDYYWRDTAMTDCECSDPLCLHCEGHCESPSTQVLYRIDIEDITGTGFCDQCGADAYESGVFVD